MNYVQLYQAIQDYSETTESTFVSNIPLFVIEAENRIYNSVQLASLRKNVTGTLTSGNPYLTLPIDWKSNFSLAVIDSSGNYNYLLNKDVNYLRAAFPNPTQTGIPTHYALFGSSYGTTSTAINTMALMLGPTPNQAYNMEMHYFYYPPTIVQGRIGNAAQNGLSITTGGTLYSTGNYNEVPLIYNSNSIGAGSGATASFTVNSSGVVSGFTLNNGGNFYTVGDILTASSANLGGAGSGLTLTVNYVTNSTGTSWVGENYDPVLFYGAMREAVLFQRQEQDVVKYYEDKFQEALAQIKRLGDGLDRGDAYRDGQTILKVKT